MQKEIEKNLTIENKGIYIDATFGLGGHTQSLLKKISKESVLIAIDKDPVSIKIAKKMTLYENRLKFHKGSFLSIKKIALKYGLKKKINHIIVDLGTSNFQLKNKLGFGFSNNSFLDMRMNPNFGMPAYKWIDKISENQLSNILNSYGEEKHCKLIAKQIKKINSNKKINTTFQLIQIVKNSLPNKKHNKHFATRIFQAIRIALNNELYELKRFLSIAPSLIKKGGYLSIISFHSLEDRIIKNFFEKRYKHFNQIKKLKTKENELIDNRQSRSAILRIFKRNL